MSIRKFHYILGIVTILLLAGCSDRDTLPLPLKQAEQCVTEYPDSALVILSKLGETIGHEGMEAQMLYHLLTTKANDKLLVCQKSDSLMKSVVRFYEGTNNPELLMEAYYYLASAYRDMNDTPRALQFFQKSVDVGRSGNNYRLMAQAYGQMGTLFAYQDLYKESMTANSKALFYYGKCGMTESRILSLNDIARMYDALGDQDSALICYDKAAYLARSVGNQRLLSSVLSEKGWVLYGMGELEQAKNLFRNVCKEEQGNALLCLGEIFMKEEEWDSARCYLSQALEHGDLYQQLDASRSLAELEESRGNLKDALCYNNVYKACNDSVRTLTQTETLGKIHALYNYQHIEEENQKLSIRQADDRIRMLILTLLVVGLSLALLVVVLYWRQRKKEAMYRERELRRLRERQYRQSRAFVEESRKQLDVLQQLLVEANKRNDLVQEEVIRLQKENVAISARRAENLLQERQCLEKQFRLSDVYRKFHEARSHSLHITDEDRAELRQAVDRAYPDFVQQLYALCPKLSSIELQICMLIRIAVPVSDIAYIVNRTKSAVTNARIRMYRKMTGKSGTAEAFDSFLQEL